MKFRVNPAEFLESLVLSGLVANPRSPTPEGASVRLKVEGNKLWQLVVTSALSIRHSIPVEVEKEGEVAVDHQMLMADVMSMREEITAHTTKSNLMLRAGRGERRRRLISLDSFPKDPVVEGVTYGIDSQDFLKGLDSVYFAVIKDNSRPGVRCVRVDEEGMYGGDGQRLAIFSNKFPFSASIPAEMIDPIRKILNLSEKVRCTQGTWLKLETDTCTLKCSLLNYPYPPIKQVRDMFENRKPRAKLILDRSDTLQVLASLLIYADRAKQQGIEYASLDMTQGYPRFVTDIPDIGRFEEEVIVQEMEGEFDELLFSPYMLSEVLSNCGGDVVVLNIFSSTEPLYIKSPEEERWSLVQSVMATRDMVVEEEEDDF